MIILFYFSITLLSLINIKIKNNVLHKILFLSLALFSAFRVGIGTDYYNYLNVAKKIIDGSVENAYFGFPHTLFYNLTLVTRSLQTYFVISTIIIFFFLNKILKEGEEEKYIILFLILSSGFYFYSMNVIRQFMGISIFLYSVKYLKIQKKKYYMINIMTVLMHPSLIITYFIPITIYFIKRINFFVIYVILLCSLLFQKVMLYFMEYFVSLIPYISKYSKYFGSEDNSLNLVQTMERLSLLIVVLIIIIYKKEILKKNKEIVLVFFIGVLLRNILHGQIGRIALTFLMVEIILFPKFIDNKGIKNYIISSVIIIYGIMRIILFINTNTANILGF